MWTDMSPCDLHVFNVRKKILNGCRLKRWRLQCHSLAFVPATAEGKFFVEEIHWLVYQWDACFSAREDYFWRPLHLCTEKSPNAFHWNNPDMLVCLDILCWIMKIVFICHMACSSSQAHTGLLAIYVHISLLYELRHFQNQQTTRG